MKMCFPDAGSAGYEMRVTQSKPLPGSLRETRRFARISYYTFAVANLDDA